MGCLYKLTSPSGKSYVGITLKDFIKRWKQHIKDCRAGCKNPLYGAMRKYGPDQFLKEILAYSDSQSVLLAFESRAATAFKAMVPNGYNLCAGGKGNLIRSEQTKAKQSETAKLRWTPEERKAQSERIKETYKDPIYYAEVLQRRKQVGAREDFKNKARAHMLAQKQDPEFVEKAALARSKRMKEIWSDPKYRDAQLRVLHSKESRAKGAIGTKRHWASNPKPGTRNGQKNSPEQNAAIGRANKLAYSNPALRAAVAQITKAQWADPAKRAKRMEAIKAGRASRVAKQTP